MTTNHRRERRALAFWAVVGLLALLAACAYKGYLP